MDCPAVIVQGFDRFYAERMRRNVAVNRIPVSGVLELTNRCNLRCAHCWISSPACTPDPAPVMTTEEVVEVFDQLAEAGCLSLLLTGGEPLVRPDFLEVYTAAKRRGFLLTLFTNGTLVTPQLADALRELPPSRIEITLYAATEETYARMTGVSGALERCLRGTELLLDRGLPLQLKSVVHRYNVHELEDMRAIALGYGVEYRHDAVLGGGVQGEDHPLQYRLPPERVHAVNMSHEQWVKDQRAYMGEYDKVPINRDTPMICGAGVSTFLVNCHGEVSPCLLLRKPAFDIRGGRFAGVWENDVKALLNPPWATDSKCRWCELVWLCDHCPATAWLEHGDTESPVDFLCQITYLLANEFGLLEQNEDDIDEPE